MLSYDDLTPPERQLWDAFPEGRRVDLRTDPPGADGTGPDGRRGARVSVRAAVLAGLLLGAHPEEPGAVAALRLTGARITGRLDLSGAEVRHTLSVEDCRFDEPVTLRGATTRTIGIVASRLPGIDAGLARVDGALTLRRSVLEGGSLVLLNARVAGELSLNGATVSPDADRGEWAVFAGGLVMEGGFFGKGLTTRGGLRLPGAQLPGGLFLQGARLGATEGVALAADRVTVSTVDCSHGFTARGTVRLRGARIEDLLGFAGARLDGGGTALVGTAMQVGEFDFRPAAPPPGTVDLRSAHTAWCRDDERSWPGRVLLDGFTYDSLGPGSTDATDATDTTGATEATDATGATETVDPPAATEPPAAGGTATPAGTATAPARSAAPTRSAAPAGNDDVARRLEWLRRNPGYAPQPYEQLAGFYRRIGHEGEARRVLLAKQRHRRRTLPPVARVWGRLLDVTVGYGYRPWLAGVWLAALALLGTLAFGRATPTPVKPGEGAPFQPLVYTLDLLIPIGGLGQRTAWYWTDGVTQSLAHALVAAGWMLTTAVVAGVTRTLSRN
ncbi:oxidoreductase [Streptomyces sp. JNUCC 64]